MRIAKFYHFFAFIKGKEHGKPDYQVLVHGLTDEDIVWTDESYGEIPTGAIQGLRRSNK
ncbi:hypothetical protein HA402_013637 [Bradysia odoriphaga]|nr:hypothetical protein HA402_013637 [Bradysia odoriphaga]